LNLIGEHILAAQETLLHLQYELSLRIVLFWTMDVCCLSSKSLTGGPEQDH
jgi:hypothetical protein